MVSGEREKMKRARILYVVAAAAAGAFGSQVQAGILVAQPFLGVTHYQIVKAFNEPAGSPTASLPRELFINLIEIDVTAPGVRSTAFALNIFLIHAFGDAISPPLIGWIAGETSMKFAFIVVSATMVVASAFWLIGTKYLPRDTEAVEKLTANGVSVTTQT